MFIAVGTPSRRGDGHADLTYVHAAAREIAGALSGFTVVVTKSTVPVGTGDEVERIMREADPRPRSPSSRIRNSCARAPRSPTSSAPTASWSAARTARPQGDARGLPAAYLNQAPMMFIGRRTAELIKYAANAFLATKITFINEIADLCEKVGADVQDVARGIGLDNRIGTKFLHAGPGYGGSCFPKDTLALVKTAQDRRAAADRRSRGRGQRSPQARDGAQGVPRSAATCAARRSPCSASPSSRTPMTCAMRRRWRGPGAARRGGQGARARSRGHGAGAKVLRDVDYCDDP